MKWLIPLSDGSDPIEITIRSERVVPLREPCVFVVGYGRQALS